MGLRPLDPSNWIEFGEDADAQIARKAVLLAARSAEVAAELPGHRDETVELARRIVAHLAQHHPERLGPLEPGEPPLVAAARLVPEDLCVMARVEGAWRLVAACVCFPSRWRLADKVGADLSGIHGPVPGYEEAVGRRVEALFDRLGPERGFWRLNWTLLDDPALFQPVAARRAPSTDPSTWWFRVERQTLTALPDSGAIAFTIRTYVSPAARVAEHNADFARDVLTVLDSAPPDTRAYKGWEGLGDRWAAAFGLARP